MEVKRNWFYALIIFSTSMLLLLGGWWLFLVFKLANKLGSLNHPAIEGNLINMVKWEGVTFLILLTTLLITLVYVYILDHKKTKALQEFFASFTHELKTPLASMKLQAQVLSEIFQNISTPSDMKIKIAKYSQRLISDSLKLEDQLDNHLQLSRINRMAPINLRVIDLKEFLIHEIKRYEQLPKVDIKCTKEEYLINADDYALQTIIRNLFENSLSHNKTLKTIDISLTSSDKITLVYNDHGEKFKGEANRLAEMFYKYNSPQGSGIGLYLIRMLMRKMNGSFQIFQDQNLTFYLHFTKGQL